MKPVAERLLAMSERTESGCREWRASKKPNGYGQIRIGDKLWYAHRAAYVEFVGPIPGGLDLDHLCRNRACIEPTHLEPVTRGENLRRSPLAPAGRTLCPYGHEYAERRKPSGARYCRPCAAAQQRARVQRRRDAA